MTILEGNGENEKVSADFIEPAACVQFSAGQYTA